jgi:hypothetical protein
MTVFLTAASRRRTLPAIAALLAAAVVMVSVQATLAARSKTPTVGDYLERVTRAMGLDSGGKPLEFLVHQGVIDPDAVRGLRSEDPLTRDLVLDVSSRLSDPPSPSFLSHAYVTNTLLADHGTGLGFVRDGGGDDENEDLFNARHKRRHHCPTPRHRHHHDDDRPCPRDP